MTANFDDQQLLAEIANATPVAYAIGAHIAECAIWDVALTDDEIATLGAGYSPLFVRPASLKNYYPCYGRRGATEGEEDWMGKTALSDVSSPAVLDDHPRIIYPNRGQRVYAPAAAVAGFRAAWVPRQSQSIGAR